MGRTVDISLFSKQSENLPVRRRSPGNATGATDVYCNGGVESTLPPSKMGGGGGGGGAKVQVRAFY